MSRLRILSVINGGGRPGRTAISYMDRITEETFLCRAMNQHGSDKGNGWHTYTRFYERLLGSRPPHRIFEFGIGSTDPQHPYAMAAPGYRPGASLRGWKTRFPAADVFGADIDATLIDGSTTFYVDQRDRDSVRRMWDALILARGGEPFDLIVDDGCHEIGPNATTLVESWHMLRSRDDDVELSSGGLYIIEDVKREYLRPWRQTLESMTDARGVIVSLDGATTTEDDNNLVVLERC